MVKHKSQSKKPQKGGVDFKKIKRKIGRKLPPPKNATNTEIKSKAIVLPEQSIASEKQGLAVSKKGLTLKELLHQSSHHNAKVRKEALLGIKDILLKHPAELKLHKLAVVEKLRERISDHEKLVRETLFQLFKSVILPGCAKDNQGPLISLMMTYIFNAMNHLAFEVRVMAFKFFDLIVQFYPSAFTLYAEKVLENYGNMLRKNQFFEDKSKLKSILAGLMRCLSLLPCKEREDCSLKNDTPIHDILHAFEPEARNEAVGFTNITKKLEDLLSILVGSFLDFLPMLHNSLHLDMQSCDCMLFMLQSTDLTVGFLVSDICKTLPDIQFVPHCEMPDVTYGQFNPPMILKKLWDVFPLELAHHLSEKDNDRIFMLNTVITKIFLQLSNLDCPPYALLEKFLEFIENSMLTKIELGKILLEKHLLPIIPYIPKLAMQVSGDWKFRILQAFTEIFTDCSPESSMKLACLAAIEEMMAPERSFALNDPIFLQYQISWIKNFPSLLISLDGKNPLCSKTVLRVLLLVGQTFPENSPLSLELDTLQDSFSGFFSTQIENTICYGPFKRLAADIQELSINCLYFFTSIGPLLLQSLVSCCLCDNLEPYLVFHILEVLHSAFRAGHIEVADYTSFHITLLSMFRVYPEEACSVVKCDGKSNLTTFKKITSIVCSCLSEIADDNLTLVMLENIIVDQICREIPMENKCAFLRLLVALDSKPTRLSDQSIVKISHLLPRYLINVIVNVGEDGHESVSSIQAKRRRYYLLPSFHLFHGSKRLLDLVLNVMVSWISEDIPMKDSNYLNSSASPPSLLCAMGSVLLHMYEDDKMKQIMSTSAVEIQNILQNLLNFLSSERAKLTLEEKHKVQSAYDRLKVVAINKVVERR